MEVRCWFGATRGVAVLLGLIIVIVFEKGYGCQYRDCHVSSLDYCWCSRHQFPSNSKMGNGCITMLQKPATAKLL